MYCKSSPMWVNWYFLYVLVICSVKQVNFGVVCWLADFLSFVTFVRAYVWLWCKFYVLDYIQCTVYIVCWPFQILLEGVVLTKDCKVKFFMSIFQHWCAFSKLQWIIPQLVWVTSCVFWCLSFVHLLMCWCKVVFSCLS